MNPHYGVILSDGVILSAAKEPCLNACPLRFAQGDPRSR